MTTILLFGTIGLFTLCIAKSRGFFHDRSYINVPFSLAQLLSVFVIYLCMTLLGLPILITLSKLIYPLIETETPFPVFVLSWLQLFVIMVTFFLIRAVLSNHNRTIWRHIWKKPSCNQSLAQDIWMGILAWLISFPIVIGIGQLFDFILYLFFHLESYEQVAVRYLKKSIYSPSQLIPALIMITLAAPIIEELLFRGCLQSYLKRYIKKSLAIVFSSICFSAFHFSFSQGIGNVSLLFSLFVFALFLGFIYERQGSLFASISLHMTLNIVSVARILLSSTE
ncbi:MULTISPECIES: type II CAAX endopeptidase family protein [Candidatus Rhabdochlamydia]|uniref:CPBP family intramembrane glutamic endopeptidase n=1 Tax=Candidatus Rhabdochlamydia TaxID=292833 RepID=UPI001BFC2B5F|nr:MULTISPECIES: type II CAAX endopeptidase family protein [Rhabdochlamydia]